MVVPAVVLNVHLVFFGVFGYFRTEGFLTLGVVFVVGALRPSLGNTLCFWKGLSRTPDPVPELLEPLHKLFVVHSG